MNRKARSILAVIVFLGASLAQAQTNRPNPADYFSQQEIANANTAIAVEYLTTEEKDIFLYSNLARMYPKKFYGLYRAFAIAKGKESELTRDRYYTSLTKELKSRSSEEPVYPDMEMFELAKCWALESGEKGLLGHDRQDCPGGFAGENCAYGYATGLEIVMQLLIDEGIPDYGHRVNLFHSEWRGLGAAIRTHRDYRFCAVQNFARTNDTLREKERKRREEERIEQERRDRLIASRQQELEAIIRDWDRKELEAANAVRSVSYLNDLEKDLYFYTNLMRLNPKKFKEAIWDQGPFFDKLLPDLKQELHGEDQYKKVARWLEISSPGKAVIPDEKRIAVLRCVIEKHLSKKENYNACFKLAGAWRFQTYYSESNFNDVMNILLTPRDFDDLFVQKSTMALQKSDPSIKVFFTPK